MNNKRLSEYAGICWHDGDTIINGSFLCVDCSKVIFNHDMTHKNPDFTTHAGYGLLHDKITERGEWEKLYRWFASCKDFGMPEYAIIRFPKLSPDKKSALIAEAIDAKIIGAINEQNTM